MLATLNVFQPDQGGSENLLGNGVLEVGEHVLPDFKRSQKVWNGCGREFSDVSNGPTAESTPTRSFGWPCKRIREPNDILPREITRSKGPIEDIRIGPGLFRLEPYGKFREALILHS